MSAARPLRTRVHVRQVIGDFLGTGAVGVGGSSLRAILRALRGAAWDNGQMRIAPGIDADEEALAGFCASNGIRRLAVFGSALREDFGPESDVDLLVEFEPGRTPGMMTIVRLEHELEGLLGGRRTVDLRTYGDLSRYFRDDVRATARPVFDAAA